MKRQEEINKLDQDEMFLTFMSVIESEAVKSATERTTKILDAHYEKADLRKIVNEECPHLDDVEKEKLLNLLMNYEILFDGTLGDFKTSPVSLEVKPGEQPTHSKAFPIPKIHEETLKKEIQRLVELGVLRKCSDSAWASPTFIIPKKNNTVRFISDLRKVNKKLVRKPFPIPKIIDIMQKLQGFTYASALDLNMGYYTIRLDPDAQKICTIILPWGKYQYLRLPMGLSCAPDIFQEKMSELMVGLDFAKTYLDDLLCLTSGTFDDHLEKLEQILIRLRDAGLRINAEKSTFCKDKIEYLGYWITRSGIKPLEKKVQAILNLEPPKNVKQTRSLLGIVQYYRDIWEKRSHILAPLTELTREPKDKKKRKKFVWGEEQQQAFNNLKKIVSRDICLAYPDFDSVFEIYTDASKKQLGAVIVQNNRPLAFYSRKLNPAQLNYTTTERELLSIVETLKEFKNVLLGHKIMIFTDHKNLTQEALGYTSERVMRWQLLMEEFGPEINYIKGKANTVADAISRLDYNGNDQTKLNLEELFTQDEDDLELFPMSIPVIAEAQESCSSLQEKFVQDKNNVFTSNLINDVEVICINNKIYIPEPLRLKILNWYHHFLNHPGATRLENTIKQTMMWPGLSNHCKVHCKKCKNCQLNKKKRDKYGHLPAKEAETTPWKTVCVDLVGPYTILNNDKALTLTAMTMIDPVTSWFEIVQVPTYLYADPKTGKTELRTDVTSARISQLFNNNWLCRYPRPTYVIYDNGSEFKLHFKSLCEQYGLKRKPTSKKNPQANSILERIHQVVSNMLRSYNLDDQELDTLDPFSEYLNGIAWAIRCTFHTTLEATPGQLVYGRDMILDIPFKANWTKITNKKQELIDKSNERENKTRVDYDYAIGDKVLITYDGVRRKLTPRREGPYDVIQVYTNGTVKIQRGPLRERINIRRLTPFVE